MEPLWYKKTDLEEVVMAKGTGKVFIDPGHGGYDPGAIVEVKDGQYSAYHWAQVAQDIVYSAEVLQRLETMGGILI